MPRRNATDRELGFLRALWEEAAMIEQNHASYVTIQMRPAASRYSFNITIELTRPATEKGLPAFAYSTLVRYPNGDNTQIVPWLWGRMQRFGDECAMADTAVAAQKQKGA